jgi:hypothetical protein
MKHAGHVLAVVAIALTCSAGASQACNKEKNSAAAASSKSKKTAAAAFADAGGHACTPEQMAACQAAKGASAVTAAHAGCEAKSVKATAVTASSGCASRSAATTVMASSEHAGCGARTTTATTAVTASSSRSKVSAVAVGAGAGCGAKGTEASVMAAGAGASCSGHGMAKAAGTTAHADCDACADMSACGAELTAAAAHTQVVPLKNGVMFVYTADSPSQITAVQSAMARRGERMAQFVTAGQKARLCTECKSLRSAMANGKLTREVVNIEGGALTLMTSNDPAVVAKIHAMVDVRGNGRTKS